MDKETHLAQMKPGRGFVRHPYKEVVENDCYNLRLLAPGMRVSTVYDIGANVGCFSIHAGELLQPHTTFAYEPVPQTCDDLRHNLNLFCRGATAVETGIGRESAVFPVFARREEFSADYTIGFARDGFHNTGKVARLLSPSDFVSRLPAPAGRYIVKMDAEGSEFYALQCPEFVEFVKGSSLALFEGHAYLCSAKELKAMFVRAFGDCVSFIPAASKTFFARIVMK